MTNILQYTTAGYTLGDVKINHLFFMGDLKVHGKDKAEIESLVSTLQLILELDKSKEREMKVIFRTECLRRFKLVMKPQLNGKTRSK